MIKIFFHLCLCLFINFLDGSHQTWKFNKNIHNEHSFFLSPIHTIIHSLSHDYIFSHAHSCFLPYAFAFDQTFVSVTYTAVTFIVSRKYNTRVTNFWKIYGIVSKVYLKYNFILKSILPVPNVIQKLYHCCISCAQLFMSLFVGIGQYFFLSLLNSYRSFSVLGCVHVYIKNVYVCVMCIAYVYVYL